MARRRSVEQMSKVGECVCLFESARSRGESSPEFRLGLYRVCLSERIARHPGDVYISPMQATGRAPGPLLDVPSTVRAVRAGASDVLEKPVTPTDLDRSLRSALAERAREAQPAEDSVDSLRPSEPLRVFERRVIEQAWLDSERNLSAAARRLGLPRTTLRDRLRKYGLR